MTGWVSRFDDWLNHVLEDCAREAGVDVDTYVARAVASQMVVDQRRAKSNRTQDILAHLSHSEVFAEAGAMPSVVAAIADPERLRALRETGLLDSPPDQVYDRITWAASAALDAPYAAVSLIDVDRQFFKSSVGLGAAPQDRQTPLERSVCQYTVAKGAPLILADARTDPVFKNHPAVLDGTVVAYLGIPLADQDGNTVGTLCVFDDKPRLWGTGHIRTLTDLAALTAEHMFGSAP